MEKKQTFASSGYSGDPLPEGERVNAVGREKHHRFGAFDTVSPEEDVSLDDVALVPNFI